MSTYCFFVKLTSYLQLLHYVIIIINNKYLKKTMQYPLNEKIGDPDQVRDKASLVSNLQCLHIKFSISY
jgi:hypothetical protein